MSSPRAELAAGYLSAAGICVGLALAEGARPEEVAAMVAAAYRERGATLYCELWLGEPEEEVRA